MSDDDDDDDDDCDDEDGGDGGAGAGGTFVRDLNLTYHDPGDPKRFEVWFLLASSSGPGCDDDDDDDDDEDEDSIGGQAGTRSGVSHDDDDDDDDDCDDEDANDRDGDEDDCDDEDEDGIGSQRGTRGGDDDDDDDCDDDDGGGGPTAPVSLVAATSTNCGTTVSPPMDSWTHPGAVGANGLIVVSVNMDRIEVEVSSVTYTPGPTGTDGTITVIYTSAPVLATCTSASFDNVDQANPFARLSEATGVNNDGVSTTVASSNTSMVYDVIGLSAITRGCRIASPGVEQSPQHEVTETNGGSINCFATQGSNATGAPSVTMSWSWGNPEFQYNFAHAIYDIHAGAGAPGGDDDDCDDDDDDEDDDGDGGRHGTRGGRDDDDDDDDDDCDD